MAIVVKIEESGKFLFDSIKGLGISEEDKEKAIQLNDLIKKKMIQLTKHLKNLKAMIKNRTRNKVEAYWRFGTVLRKIFFESGLIEPSEKKLFWLNVRLHTPHELLAKDRGPNRMHIAYCFRLAGYPKKLALKREWSEWVYLFDSPFINSEERFDNWDKTKIETEHDYTPRENTRFFIQCLNSILKDVETKDLTDEELIRCYEGSWSLSKKLIDKLGTSSDKPKKDFKTFIRNKSNYIGQLIDGKIAPEEFAKIIIGP